jgi:hypothetical protein
VDAQFEIYGNMNFLPELNGSRHNLKNHHKSHRFSVYFPLKGRMVRIRSVEGTHNETFKGREAVSKSS